MNIIEYRIFKNRQQQTLISLNAQFLTCDEVSPDMMKAIAAALIKEADYAENKQKKNTDLMQKIAWRLISDQCVPPFFSLNRGIENDIQISNSDINRLSASLLKIADEAEAVSMSGDYTFGTKIAVL